MTFKEYKGLDLVSVGNEVLDRWKKNHAFEKSLEVREGAPEFIFFEGPPSANGKPASIWSSCELPRAMEVLEIFRLFTAL